MVQLCKVSKAGSSWQAWIQWWPTFIKPWATRNLLRWACIPGQQEDRSSCPFPALQHRIHLKPRQLDYTSRSPQGQDWLQRDSSPLALMGFHRKVICWHRLSREARAMHRDIFSLYSAEVALGTAGYLSSISARQQLFYCLALPCRQRAALLNQPGRSELSSLAEGLWVSGYLCEEELPVPKSPLKINITGQRAQSQAQSWRSIAEKRQHTCLFT